jgi:2-dehydro-3-deoxyphosphooctonate aldolase (KDO 8-P synthase)
LGLVKIGDITIGSGHPIVLIAGPCVIEDENSCQMIAENLKKMTAEIGMPFIFKASYDKANRTSINSFRGPGLKDGLHILKAIREELGVPVLTDVHCVTQVMTAAEAVDVLQIPAFLCRQTDLIVVAAQTGKAINVKKGQFMAPDDMRNVVEKIKSTENDRILLTERGTCFGYNNLVVDMRSLVIMRQIGYPVVFDATHSVQLPGGVGTASGGQREFVPYLTRAATASGIDALFMEVHPRPDEALCDGSNMWQLDKLKDLLQQVIAIDNVNKGFTEVQSSQSVNEKATKVRILIMDVDGVLTDGKILIGSGGFEAKFFDSKDGLGIKIALNAGLKVAMITGRESEAVSRRAEELGIEEVYQGVLDKLEIYHQILLKHSIKDENVAYIGDDLVDLPILRKVGFSVAVGDASDELKRNVNYVTEHYGGRGAVRETIELLLRTQGKWHEIIANCL